MLDAKNILLPYSFSAASGQAVPYALKLAARTGATLHTLSVEVLRGSPSVPSGTWEALQDDVRERFDQTVWAHARDGYGPEDVHFVHATRRDIEATSAILRYAAAEDIDLIVMGTHGRSGLRRFALGSVAEKVVRKAPCPVLTAGRAGKDGPPKTPAIQRILVPTDFSARSRAALSRARALAARFDAEIDLFHAVEETLHPAFYSPWVQSIYDAQPRVEEKVTAGLEEFYRTTEGASGKVTFSARPGSAPKAIAEHAEASGADLIVMATHGRTGLAHYTMGSVAEKVARRAPCPVLTARSFGCPLVSASGDGAATKPDALSVAPAA